MSEPVYRSRPDYEAIARAALTPEIYDALPVWQQLDAVDEAMRAHRELHAGFIKDRDLNPRQLAFREAYRAFVAPPKPAIPEPEPIAPIVEAEPPAPIAPPIIPNLPKRKKS